MSTIQFSPFTSIFENKASGTVVFGSPGSGKTFFLLNVIANSLMMQQRFFAIDPKNDLGVISDIFPNVEYIDINNIKPGALNPFKVINNLDTNTLLSIISIICGDLTDQQIISITPIINDFINKNRRSIENMNFSNVADYLYANDNIAAQAIGTKLQTHRDSKYGALLFDETVDTMKLNAESKIISLHGMDLPKFDSKKLNENQKFNSAIVFIICRMLRDILTSNNYPTLFVMDEGHIALRNESFKDILDEFLVLGRSLNVATIIATQNPSHVPESISQLIASKFCFKSSTNEASTFLNLFFNKDGDNMADFESIIYQISGFESGRCFYIDSCNRTGIFKVVSLFGDDITSNPLMKKRKKK